MRRQAALLLALSLAGAPGAALADAAASRNNEGNRLYDQKRYDAALKLYTDAQAARPGAPELHYNIGNVLYRKGEFDKAVEEYLRAQASRDPALSQAATYNRGNALLMQGRLQDAVNAYVQALRARPDDAQAKRNLELALRMLQTQQQEQPQPSPQQQGQDDQKKPPQGPRQAPQGEGKAEKSPHSPSGQMSEEEARRILEALRDEEKEGVRKHAQASVPRDRQPEKDW